MNKEIKLNRKKGQLVKSYGEQTRVHGQEGLGWGTGGEEVGQVMADRARRVTGKPGLVSGVNPGTRVMLILEPDQFPAGSRAGR